MLGLLHKITENSKCSSKLKNRPSQLPSSST